MNELKEQEIKVLEVNVEELEQRLEEIGANKVYDDIKVVTTSDPMSKVTIHRVSYQLGKIDIDIDTFPAIPSFLKVNTEHLEEEGYNLGELLNKLGISHPQMVIMGTEDIHRFYGWEYFEVYKIDPLQENNSDTYKGPSK